MKLTHLGRIVDLDPKQTAVENRIVLMLFKHGSVRQSNVFRITHAGQFGKEVFERAVERLVTEDVVARATTTRSDSLLLSLTEWGKMQADSLAYAAANKS